MFDLQSLCSNQSRPDWISTAHMIQLEQTAKSVQYLWSKRNIFSYPQSNVDVDSRDSLHCDLNRGHENIYIEECEMENIVAFNDLLPPLTRSGELSHLYGYNLTRSLPQNTIRLEAIQVHIQCTDRVYDVIQNAMQQSNDYDHYVKYKRKKRRLRELSASNSNIRQSKRIRNKLHREIYSQVNEDATDATSIRKKAVSEDSVSSMSITPEIANKNNKNSKKRKLANNLNGSASESMPKRKKRKIAIIDNDVIGDSEQEEEEEEDDIVSLEGVANSLIYEVTVDDLKLDFFIQLFPQLLATHHLVYCKHSYQHYYYQNYFSSASNKYEWIQTDMQLLNLYHRYIDEHFETHASLKNMDRSKYNEHKNRRIVLFFQIRPRSDTKSDEECIEKHKQLLMDNLIEMNEMRKKKDKQEAEQEEEDTFYIDAGVMDEDEDDETTNYNQWAQDKLVTNVIQAIHEQNGDCEEYEYKYNIAGSYESGLCGFCQKKFSTNKRSEEKWIECEFCRKWYHVLCSGLSSKDFFKFQSKQNDENNRYKCLMCSEQ